MEVVLAFVTGVVAAVKARGTLANDDVQELLAVSDATATRYLESL